MAHLSAQPAHSTSSLAVLTSTSGGAAADLISGHLVLVLVDSSTNLWSASIMFARDGSGQIAVGGGTKALSAELDRVRITTSNGTDTFDAGTINIMYEE